MKNLLVTLINGKYIDQAKQLFASAYKNGGWRGDRMLLTYKVSEEDVKWFKDRGWFIKPVDLIPYSTHLRNNYYPPIVFCKFYLFQEEFKNWENILFLDCDIMVRKSLKKLENIKGFFAPNATGIDLKREFYCIESDTYKQLQKIYPLKGNAFNTGVMVFNTEVIKNDTFDKLIDLTKEYGWLTIFGEEPILNLYFYRKWKKLSSEYNCYPHHNEYHDKKLEPEEVKKATILHFIAPPCVSACRPWDATSVFYDEWETNLKDAERINYDE